MATFNVNISSSFVSGTAVTDTFNISATSCTVLGLDGSDTFNVFNGAHDLYVDGGLGNDTFNILPFTQQ